MHDPTQSRYRYLEFSGSDSYRRFIKNEKNIETTWPKTQEADIPSHGSYAALLFRVEWKAKRIEILNRDQCCVICTANHSLQVHHRQYHFIVSEHRFKNPWEYAGELMITLCESCHKRGHAKFKVPTINL